MDEPASEKEHEPTERRLQEARAKGEVPVGRDLLAAAGLLGLVLALAVPSGFLRVADRLQVMLDQADRLAPWLGSGQPAGVGALALDLAWALAPVFALPAIAVIGVLIAQRGLVFAPARLEPKLSRLSLLSGAKRRFGREGLFDFAKSTVKLVLIATVLGYFLVSQADIILASMRLDSRQVLMLVSRLVMNFLLMVLVIQLVIGVIDMIWQWFEHRRRNRMSRKELTDELRQSEGDPQMKAQRRQKALAIASDRMMAEVATANVVVVNPTHYAVALRWDRKSRGAPVCVAKGVDEVAARIREKAAEAGVPLRHDPPTARALYAAVAIGEEIHPEHYRPVAAAIRFAEGLRARVRARTGR
jgi:flagellar biosynthesis protein FlhB